MWSSLCLIYHFHKLWKEVIGSEGEEGEGERDALFTLRHRDHLCGLERHTHTHTHREVFCPVLHVHGVLQARRQLPFVPVGADAEVVVRVPAHGEVVLVRDSEVSLRLERFLCVARTGKRGKRVCV